MPLSENQQVNETADKLVKTLRGIYGTPQAYRPAHAKGRLVKGVFTPTSEAASLSKAQHFNEASTPIIVRFSSSTGIPSIADTDGNANPRGFGLRFVLGDNGHKHTDIIAHSTKYFPVRTGEEFLHFFEVIGNGTIGEYLGKNPAAAAFVNDPKPAPASFTTEKYFGVNAFKLVAKDGKGTFIRYRIVPERFSVLSDEEVASKSDSYLTEELVERLSKGPATLKLFAQVAETGDVTDDATEQWPEERRQVELGKIELHEVEPEDQSKKEQQHIIFDPVPRVEGVEPSEDPLLEMRASVYLQSGRGRRAAESSA